MLDASATLSARTLPVSFPSGDARLGGTLFLPGSAPRAGVVLNPATGVPARFYRHFALSLAETQNLACLTYDYHGMGASLGGHVRDCDATMTDWALVDQPAARAEMRRYFPDLPLWVIGHSLGAMLLPMQTGTDEIARAIAVCSGYVHHSDHPWPYQALARLFWFGHAPVLTALLGYLPGRHIGFGADLPAGVYWEWRRWCTRRDFFWPEVGNSLPEPYWPDDVPVRLIAVADDDTIPPACVWRLERAYGTEATERVLIEPGRFGLGRIGHLGVFSPANAAVWPTLIG